MVKLAPGSIVWKLSPCNEFREARRLRKERSMGTVRVLTVWPGRKGQAVVQGSAGSYVSVEPLISYCGLSARDEPHHAGAATGPYIVVVGGAHGKAPIPTETACAVANNVLERIASPPLVVPAPYIAAHGVKGGKVVPRTNELDAMDRGVCLTGNRGVSFVSGRDACFCTPNQLQHLAKDWHALSSTETGQSKKLPRRWPSRVARRRGAGRGKGDCATRSKKK